jgi:hypothetical protein
MEYSQVYSLVMLIFFMKNGGFCCRKNSFKKRFIFKFSKNVVLSFLKEKLFYQMDSVLQ